MYISSFSGATGSPSFGRLVLQSTSMEQTKDSEKKVALAKSDPCGFSWPTTVFNNLVKNKEIQKFVAESEKAGLDVIATYNDTHRLLGSSAFYPRLTPYISLSVSKKNKPEETKEIERIEPKQIHLFDANEYVEYPQNVAYLNDFNKAMSILSKQYTETANNIIKELPSLKKQQS